MINLIWLLGRFVTPLGPFVHASPLNMAIRMLGRPLIMQRMKPDLTKL